MKTITIIPNPTWEQTLKLLKEQGRLKINSSDYKKFMELLDTQNVKYSMYHERSSKLTCFELFTIK